MVADFPQHKQPKTKWTRWMLPFSDPGLRSHIESLPPQFVHWKWVSKSDPHSKEGHQASPFEGSRIWNYFKVTTLTCAAQVWVMYAFNELEVFSNLWGKIKILTMANKAMHALYSTDFQLKLSLSSPHVACLDQFWFLENGTLLYFLPQNCVEMFPWPSMPSPHLLLPCQGALILRIQWKVHLFFQLSLISQTTSDSVRCFINPWVLAKSPLQLGMGVIIWFMSVLLTKFQAVLRLCLFFIPCSMLSIWNSTGHMYSLTYKFLSEWMPGQWSSHSWRCENTGETASLCVSGRLNASGSGFNRWLLVFLQESLWDSVCWQFHILYSGEQALPPWATRVWPSISGSRDTCS